MTITELVTAAHKNAVEKGFYERLPEKNIGEMLMLIVSELGEALEADRKGKYVNNRVDIPKLLEVVHEPDKYLCLFQACDIKDSFEDELADAVIRIADLAGWLGIDLEAHIQAKMAYNRTRPPKHGKKY